MRLFEKMTNILRDNTIAETYSKYVLDDYKSMLVKLNKLKEILTTLSQTRRKNQTEDRNELINHFLRVLEYIKNNLESYNYDLNDLCYILKLNPNLNLTHKNSKIVLSAINSKIEMRKDFETIYSNFKSTAKKFDDIPMNYVLKQMREIFGFNNTKTQSESSLQKYYDSTSMKIKHIIP